MEQREVELPRMEAKYKFYARNIEKRSQSELENGSEKIMSVPLNEQFNTLIYASVT